MIPDDRISITSVIELVEWVEMQLPDASYFTLNAMQNAFIPVAIINNTPLCPGHMWLAIDIYNGRQSNDRRR